MNATLQPSTVKTIQGSSFPQNDWSTEEVYFRLWEREQEHTKTRWSVTTFFISISFAIFGFSLQTPKPPVPPIVTHSVALAIYWFACVLFWRFNSFTTYLRNYLQEMEVSNQVTINLQTRTHQLMEGQSPTYFASLFKRAIGFSPHEYVIRQRVERAKMMLAKTDLSIADIALQVGFSSQSHLTPI